MTLKSSPVRSLHALACALLTTMLISQHVHAQVGATEADTAQVNEARRAPTPQARIPLEGPVSRTEYVLGPGDVLTLALFGFRSDVFTLDVAPEGTVVVPEVGVVRVGGMNLDEAEQAIRSRVRRYFSDVEVNLTLAALRSFRIFVVGNVRDAGAREASPVTRVSELIEPIDADGVIHRNVVVRRGDRELRVDLARFLRSGDLSQNPTLRAGDVIQVPTIDETVTVRGRFAYPGVYEFRPGETVADVVALANGNSRFPAEAADTIQLLRFEDASTSEIMKIARSDAVGELGHRIPVRPFDALFLPGTAHYKEHTTARVVGEVSHPGEYPIQTGVTTVGDLIRMAGGLTPEASLFDAVLTRTETELARDTTTALRTIPPELLSPDELRILQVTERADTRNVVLDLGEIVGGDGSPADVPLRNDDQLFVPTLRNEVAVLGAVMQPGIVTYVPGQPIDYFVQVAGGYTRRADRGEVSVLKGRQGNRLHRHDVRFVEPGDRIVVPFKEPRTFLERVQTVEGVVGTISGFVVTLVALDRLWDTLNN